MSVYFPNSKSTNLVLLLLFVWYLFCYPYYRIFTQLLFSFYSSARETHQIAEANQEKNAKLREAFGLSQFYVDGSAFDPDRKNKEEAAKAAAIAQKQYA